MMMGQGVNELVIPYITDGLEFYLDGIDKGTSDNGWQDLISKEVFPWISRATPTGNGVVFVDGNYFMDNSNIPEFLMDNRTIEVCCSNCANKQYNVVVSQSSTVKRMFFSREDATHFAWETGSTNNRIDINIPLTFTASANKNCGMVNSVVSNTYSKVQWNGNNSNVTRIGGRTSPYKFVGTLHAIRLYNRVLSQEEMLYNQRIDNERFNLGLDI